MSPPCQGFESSPDQIQNLTQPESHRSGLFQLTSSVWQHLHDILNIVIKFLPQILQQTCILCNRFVLLFSDNSFHFDLIYCVVSLAFEYVRRAYSQISIAVPKNVHASPIMGSIESHSHDMIIKSSSFQASNFGSFSVGPVPRRWLSLPFPLRQVQAS